MRLKPWCEECGVEGWDQPLALHHTELRSQGPRYTEGGDYGVDNPNLLKLLCDRCHKKQHPGPQFGVTA